MSVSSFLECHLVGDGLILRDVLSPLKIARICNHFRGGTTFFLFRNLERLVSVDFFRSYFLEIP